MKKNDRKFYSYASVVVIALCTLVCIRIAWADNPVVGQDYDYIIPKKISLACEFRQGQNCKPMILSGFGTTIQLNYTCTYKYMGNNTWSYVAGPSNYSCTPYADGCCTTKKTDSCNNYSIYNANCPSWPGGVP